MTTRGNGPASASPTDAVAVSVTVANVGNQDVKNITVSLTDTTDIDNGIEFSAA